VTTTGVPADEPTLDRERRLTPRARRVFAYLAGHEAPVTAQQLHAELRPEGERISQRTASPSRPWAQLLSQSPGLVNC
jgi:hypothetical protein